MKKEYWIAAVVFIVIVLIIVFRNKISALFTKPSYNAGDATPTITPQQAAQGGVSTALDYNKLLKQGVKGNEVKLLQSWLNVAQDGDFGPITAQALFNRKNTIEITLAQFSLWPDKTAATPAPMYLVLQAEEDRYNEGWTTVDDTLLNAGAANTIQWALN